LVNLFIKNKTLIINSVEPENFKLLLKPLHKLFLRGSIGAILNEQWNEWQIAVETEISNILLNLIKHFSRYDIDYQLDEKCEKILEQIKEEKQKYKEILDNGKRVKYKMEDEERNAIKCLLTGDFKRELRDFQLHALYHLLTIENGANFSVPGSGKTTVALAFFHVLKKRGKIDSLLVIGPTSSFQPWEDEFQECFGRKPRSIRLAGKPLKERLECYLTAYQYELLLITYHTTANDIEDIIRVLKARKYLTILDESHYIKRPQGGKLATATLKLAPFSTHRVILSGTPMPNNPSDLWSQFQFLWYKQQPLGSLDKFLNEIRDAKKINLSDTIKERIGPLFFRTTKSQLDLPAQKYKIHKCNLSPLQKRIYIGVAIRFLSQLSESPQEINSLREWRRARTIRLLQIASNPALLLHQCKEFNLPPIDLRNITLSIAIEHYAEYEIPEKIVLATELANEICSSGEKVIIWTTFVHNLGMLATILKKHNPLIIFGGIIANSEKDEITRETIIRRFKEDPNCKILIANPAACAESISLHRVCHQAIYLDRSFNCAHYLQSLDRIHRLGLVKNQLTFYHLLVSSGSIDEIVHDRLKQKMQAMQQILEGELPHEIPGYWSEYLGTEEEVDLDLVEKHIKSFYLRHGSKTQ